MLGNKTLAAMLLLAVGFFTGCSAKQDSASVVNVNPAPSQPALGTSQVSVTLSDAPPAGVTVLYFELTITSAILQPTVGSDVPLLPGGRAVEIELKKLETEDALLSTLSVPSGTYKGLQLTLANPDLTVQNTSPNDIGTCKKNTICELTPAASGSVTFAAAPFPLTLVAGTPRGLKVDVHLNKIINSDLSVTLADPSVLTVTELTAVPISGPPTKIDDDEFAGMITSLDAANNRFTVQNALNSVTETVNTDAGTEFEDFDEHGCKSENFSCLAVWQVVEVETILESDGSILAKEVKLEESSGAKSVEGSLASLTGNPTTQFQMVVLDEEPDMSGLKAGTPITVTFNGTPQFDIGLGGLAVPAGGTFAGPSDLLLGQDIQIEPGTITTGSPISIATSHVKLHTSQFTATVSAVNGSAITVNNLPAVFGLSTLTIQTTSKTDFDGVLGSASLVTGNIISIRGLLFKTASGPVVVAAKIRKRS